MQQPQKPSYQTTLQQLALRERAQSMDLQHQSVLTKNHIMRMEYEKNFRFIN